MLTLICARGNSKGIKNKNIKIFNKKPLIFYSIQQALKSKYIEEVFVSTDSKKIAKIAKNLGAKIKFIRSKKLSLDKTPEINVWKDAIKRLQKINKVNYSHLCVLPVTSPLRSVKDINKTIEIYRKSKVDGVLCVAKSSRNPYFNMIKISKNLVIPFFKNNKKIFVRQNAPEIYDITTVAYVYNAKFILNANHILDGKISYNKVPRERSVDIDDIIDFKFAEFLQKTGVK